MRAREQAVRPFYVEQNAPLRNVESHPSSGDPTRRQKVKQRLKEELNQIAARQSLEAEPVRPPENLVRNVEDGHLHDKDYIKEWKERSFGTPALSVRKAPSSASGSSSEDDMTDPTIRRHSFNAMRMPGLPPGVSTLPANVSVSGHVLSTAGGSSTLNARSSKPHSQLRLTSGTYAARPAKPSTLNHSKRNSATTISDRDRDTLSRDYSFKQDPVSIAARQRLSKELLTPPTPRSADGHSVASSSSNPASTSYSASTYTTAATAQYNPFSYIPSAAIQKHRSAALRAAQNSYSSGLLKDSVTAKSSRISELSIADDASSGGSILQWDDPIDLTTIRNESNDNLQLDYVPSLEHPERHRNADHAKKIGGVVVPASVDKGVSSFSRNWEKTKLDVRFAMLRAKRQIKR